MDGRTDGRTRGRPYRTPPLFWVVHLGDNIPSCWYTFSANDATGGERNSLDACVTCLLYVVGARVGCYVYRATRDIMR